MTKSINALIIDDESDARENVRRHLEVFSHQIKVVGEAKNVDEGILKVQAFNPDIIFLDIAMPKKSGFELLAELPDYQGEVIFITSFNQFAEEAFKYLAMGYIVKPIDEEEFNACVKKAISYCYLKNQERNYEHLLEIMSPRKTENAKIVLPTEAGYEVLNQSDLYFLEAQRNYTTVNLKDSKILVSRNLAKIENFLSSSSFMRIHRSFTVNVEKVKTISKEGIVTLKNNRKLHITKSKKELLAEKIANL